MINLRLTITNQYSDIFLAQFKKTVVISNISDNSKLYSQEETSKRWWNLLHIAGKASESNFQVKQYEYQMKQHEEIFVKDLDIQLKINAIGRIALSNETNQFFHGHIKKSRRMAVEVMTGDNHLMGFIDLNDLLLVGRKNLRTVVPLWLFNNITFMKNCSYPSVFKPNKVTKERKPKKEKKKLGTKSSSTASLINSSTNFSEIQEVPFMNDCGQQVFIILELELEKPLNVEIYEDSHESLLTKLSTKPVESDAGNQEKLKNFKKRLHLISKQILETYKEPDVEKIVKKMISDGYFQVVEDHLITQLGYIQPFGITNKDDLTCHLSSKLLNYDFVDERTHQNLMAKVYKVMDMEINADRIILRQIKANSCEETWNNYAVHTLRKEKFSKAIACIEKGMTYNQQSIIGHILKAYVSFKLQNYSESKRLISFMQFKHGDSEEFTMIQHLVNVKKCTNGFVAPDFTNIKVHPQLQQVYESHEVLWFATPHDKTFLSFQNPFIRSAVLFIKLGCYDFAELSMSEYYAKYGANINHSYLLAVIDAMKGDYKSSLIHLDKISKQDVGNHQLNYDKIVVLMSLMLMKSGQYERGAVELLEGHVFTDNQIPEYFLLFLMLGTQHNLNGDYVKAESCLLQAHKILPSELSFLELGKCYLNLNKVSTAEQCFHQSIRCGFNSEEIWNHLKEIYQEQNRNTLTQLCMENLNTMQG